MNPHLRFCTPQLDEGLSVVMADGVQIGEVRAWNAGGRTAELVELHTDLEVIERASSVQLRWHGALGPTAAQAGTIRLQQALAGELGPTRWFHLSLSRAEPAPTPAELAGIQSGQTWAVHMEEAGDARPVGYLLRERAGTSWVDHYLLDATYRPPCRQGDLLELRRLDAGPTDGAAFARLTAPIHEQARYYQTACSWHRHALALPAAQVAC